MAHKIKVKLGDAEFEAEGAEDKVQAQYEQFLEALQARSAAKSNHRNQSPTENPSGAGSHPGEDDARIGRIFDLRQDGVVVFRAHPPEAIEAADQLTLLLLGYRRLASKDHVLSTHLSRSCRLSGFGDVAIDTTAKPHIPRFILKGGQRKGTTYTLTTQGVNRAWEIATQMPV